MKKKGFIVAGLTAAVLGIAIAIASVLIFFYIFKVHVDLQMREEYVWNKVQDVPMSLLSMDIGNESFVSKVNKAHYSRDTQMMEQLEKEVNDNIEKQLFYYFNASNEYPFRAAIKVNGISLETKFSSNCKIEVRDCPSWCWWWAGMCTTCDCYCSSDCPFQNKLLAQNVLDPLSCKRFDIEDCIQRSQRAYSAKYPFPLTFNSSGILVDEMSYVVTEMMS